MAKVIPPHRLIGDFNEIMPLVNDNFEKMATNLQSFGPIDTTGGSCGAYIPSGYLLDAVSIVFDKPDYDGFAAFLPKYDIFVDHPVATGTIAIDNTFGISTVTISVGDRFIAYEDTDYLAGDARARYWYATSATSVVAGASGGFNCAAEAPGTTYNKSGYEVFRDFAALTTTRKFINLFPDYGGSGSGDLAVYTVTAAGGSDTDDYDYQWPNGSNLTTNQKKLSIGSHLSITADPGQYEVGAEESRTDPKSIATLAIRNEDASAHRYYIKVGGVLLSGKS
jgi:hypothetical protein